MLGGHGSELVGEDGDWLGAGIGSWGLSSQVDLLFHSVSDSLMGRHERLVQLLALKVNVTGRCYHVQDPEGVPHEGSGEYPLRRSVNSTRLKGRGSQLIEEVPDRRELTDMSNV
jgi:hypothetical protein